MSTVRMIEAIASEGMSRIHASAEELADISEDLIEPLLESISHNDTTIGDTDPYLELACTICEDSEGGVFQIADILERAPYFVEEGNAHSTLVGCMGLSVSGLYLSVDPEEYGLVFDGLCSLALVAADCDGNLTGISGSLQKLRDRFNAVCRSLDDDSFLRVIQHMEKDEYGDVPATLKDFFYSVSEERSDSDAMMKCFIERFFECAI